MERARLESIRREIKLKLTPIVIYTRTFHFRLSGRINGNSSAEEKNLFDQVQRPPRSNETNKNG